MTTEIAFGNAQRSHTSLALILVDLKRLAIRKTSIIDETAVVKIQTLEANVNINRCTAHELGNIATVPFAITERAVKNLNSLRVVSEDATSTLTISAVRG